MGAVQPEPWFRALITNNNTFYKCTATFGTHCINVIYPKKHSPEVWHIPSGTLCLLGAESIGFLVKNK
jgi:hypothetical protein